MRVKLATIVLGLSVLALIALQITSPLGKGFAISATADIKPDTLNLNMHGKWITAYIELHEDYNVTDIDESTILLEDLFKAEWSRIEDGTLMVKFDASSVINYLWDRLYHMGGERGSVTLKVTGQLLDGTQFSGSDTITIMDPIKN